MATNNKEACSCDKSHHLFWEGCVAGLFVFRVRTHFGERDHGDFSGRTFDIDDMSVQLILFAFWYYVEDIKAKFWRLAWIKDKFNWRGTKLH